MSPRHRPDQEEGVQQHQVQSAEARYPSPYSLLLPRTAWPTSGRCPSPARPSSEKGDPAGNWIHLPGGQGVGPPNRAGPQTPVPSVRDLTKEARCHESQSSYNSLTSLASSAGPLILLSVPHIPRGVLLPQLTQGCRSSDLGLLTSMLPC